MGDRTRNIAEFYTKHALSHAANSDKLDRFANPTGAEFDLGIEGAFKGFKVLVLNTCSDFPDADFNKNAKPPLQAKGFDVAYTKDQDEFIRLLPGADVAWIISNTNSITNRAEFIKAVTEFHEAGGGLYLWADNTPWFSQANEILAALLNPKVSLTGNTPGQKTLAFGDAKKAGQFGAHPITYGISNLYEGNTVSYPAENDQTSLRVIATSTDNHPVILAAEPGEGGLKVNSGRIVVDCGFTKLYHHWDTAGTARYVANANVWLVGVDLRLRRGLPPSRRRT